MSKNFSELADKPNVIPAPVCVYDEEFYGNLTIAKEMIAQLDTKGDRAICKKWIGKLVHMKSDDPVVKKNRNAFFKYMLSVLSKAINSSQKLIDRGPEEKDDNQYMCKWSNDKRTYIAAKPLPGLGTLVYLAVSKDTNVGWDHP